VQDSVHLLCFQTGHGLLLVILGELLACEFDLVQESQGGASLFFHDLVDEFAIEADIQLP
jgi:hypothetical protein